MEKGGVKILIAILVILIIIAGAGLAYKIIQDRNNTETISGEENKEQVAVEEEKTVQIFSGNDRPIAVMIDNHSDAWPQAGLNQAYMVYEIIVEGGETRLMALFKGVDLDKIGPVRSARHYFIDYAMENDAIYVHFGQSPQAESDIKKYSIHDINGIAEDGTTFWRVKDKSAPHNAVTSTQKLLESAKSKNYRTTSTEESVLNYVTDEVNLEEGEVATTITIPHSDLQTVEYEYDEENKVYVRYARGEEQTDWDTDEPVTAKNIIITFCDNYTLSDKENKGRWYLGTTKTAGSCREVYICDTSHSMLCDYKKLQNKYRKEYGKKYKRYIIEEVRNKYGKLVEYKIIQSNVKRNYIEMVFTRKDGTYSGTDIIKYLFKIIHHKLKINCRFYDLR